jgi:hypothetical protein
MEQKTIPYDCQKDIMTFLSKLAQFAEALAKTLPVLCSLSLIPGFLTIIIYGMTLHWLLIQDLASATCVALTAFVCATLLATLVIIPILLQSFDVTCPSFVF